MFNDLPGINQSGNFMLLLVNLLDFDENFYKL